MSKLSPTEIYNGRKIFLIGSTGFMGKVTLSMLLYRFPNIGRVYVTVRARSQEESEIRFWNSVITAPPFNPLRERYGSALEGFIRERVVVLGGDIGDTNLGYTDDEAQKVADDIDIVVNSAGNVTFNPTLESALRTNVVGTQNVIAFAKRMKRPALVHVSTCFVAGNRSGPVWENDPVLGYFPRKHELEGVEFSVEQEIKDCARLAERVREEARDAMMAAQFRDLARKRLNDEGRDTDDPDALGLAVARERKVWTRTRLTELGMERSAWWGWPNIYTYTKALGEQLVAAETGIVRSIVRPSIVESALSYPFPGWNEGFTTTAPIIFSGAKGPDADTGGRKTDPRHHPGGPGCFCDAGGDCSSLCGGATTCPSGGNWRFKPGQHGSNYWPGGTLQEKAFSREDDGIKTAERDCFAHGTAPRGDGDF